MESSFAITGKDYTLIVSDTSAAHSIVRMKDDEDKMRVLSPHLVMAYNGEPGDTVQFAEYVQRNLRLYGIRNNVELRPAAAAAWTRRELADSLRSRSPYQVNLLLAGFDVPSSRPALYWIDYLGTLASVPYAAHGYASFFVTSTLDRYHTPGASLEEGLELARRCADEVEKRLIVSGGGWKVRVVDREGAREIKLREGQA